MSNTITEERVLKSLATVEDPELHKDLVSLGFIEDLKVSENDISFTVMLTTPACPMKEKIRKDCEEALHRDIPEASDIAIRFGARVAADPRLAADQAPFKNVIAVGAGKGGVGKTTVAVNLALALASTGAKVGILDADVYGPNIPQVLGTDVQPDQRDGKLLPVEKHGVQMMSMGFLIPAGQALVWRGPMIHNAINQLVTQVAWGELDYLVVDLPPGTGDAQMSLAQQLPLTGAVVVTTPQGVSVSDTLRGIDAFRKLEVPVLGVVENMAGPIFGSGAGEDAAQQMEAPFLGRLPLEAEVAAAGEAGEPLMAQSGDDEARRVFREMAGSLAASVSVIRSQG
ncbi:MAG: Mrp/NBP35 family ATP-binding protein [Spirochaetales bacterium]|nr:Mrp/NBP35 family ATP-binding protein [Spirochaetales bacterium]